MGRVEIKPGCDFSVFSPAGARILEALKIVARKLDVVLVITSACDGPHAVGSAHFTGEAYDVRSHGFAPEMQTAILREVMLELQRGDLDVPTETSGGIATLSFFGFLEHPGTPTEHWHIQRRKHARYTIVDYLAS